MKQHILPVLFFFLLLPACSEKKSNIITYDLKRKDYIEAIDATGTIQAVNNVLITAPTTSASSLMKVIYLVEDGAYVKKGDTICIFDVPDLFNLIESNKVGLQNLEGDLKKFEAENAMQLSLLNAQVETNKARMAITMLDTLKMKFAPPAEKRLLALEMEKANIEKNKLQKKFSAQKRISSSELIKRSLWITSQKSRVKLFQDQINSLSLVSPVDGIIMHIQNYRLEGAGYLAIGDIEEGSTTLSKMSVLQIPDLKTMQVLVEVQEADYKKIKNGQRVFINVEAAANLQTTGKIKMKTLLKANTQIKTAIKTYQIIISIDSCHLKMKPGLSAMCRIIIDQVKDTLAVPDAAIFEKDSSKIVYVAHGKKFEPVTINTGTSNGSVSIITKGLKGGETLALTQPPQKMIREMVKINPYRENLTGTDKGDTVAGKIINKGVRIK